MIRCTPLLLVVIACSHGTTPPGGTQPPDGSGSTTEPPTVIPGTTFASRDGTFLGVAGAGVDASEATSGPASTFDLELVGATALADGTQLHVRTSDLHYLGVTGGAVFSTATVAGPDETFTIRQIAGDGTIAPGDAVWLVTASGDYITAAAGAVAADHAVYDSSATWTIDGAGGAPVVATFQASNGQYVSAENGGGGAVDANRDVAGPWETFHLDLIDGGLADGVRLRIRANNDQYVQAVNHGGGDVDAASNKAGAWETFTLHRIAGAGPIAAGDAIAIATDDGHYVSAENGGGGVLVADRTAIGPWETFAFNGEAALPAPPSRDAVVNVHADFANLRDSKDRPMFTPFIFSLMDDCDNGSADACADVEDWLTRLQAAGDTHIAVSITYDYGEDLGWAPRYPIHGLDLTQRVPVLRTYLERLIRRGFIPILFLGCDGHASDPNGGYNDPVGWSYGLPWCEANLPGIVGQLRSGRDLAPYILWIGGWDGCFPDWSPDQTNEFHTFLRSIVGDAANIATEFGNGYIHMGNGGSDWYQPGLDQVDVFFIEFATNILDPNVSCGVQQVASRMLGPDVTFQAGPPCDGTSPPFYLQAPRSPRGPLVVVAWEYAAYLATRKQLDPAGASAQGAYLSSLGFRRLGNGH